MDLIDTPRHVDFSHEVRRSLMSCEGALLVVDASQGVEAQTVPNLYLAMEFGLEVVSVINKIDLPSAAVDRVMEEIDRDLGLDPFASIQVSAKLGTASTTCWRRSSSTCPRPRATRRSHCGRCSSTPSTTPTAAPSCWCASATAPCAPALRHPGNTNGVTKSLTVSIRPSKMGLGTRTPVKSNSGLGDRLEAVVEVEEHLGPRHLAHDLHLARGDVA